VTSVKMGYNLQHPKIANDITHKRSNVISMVTLYSKRARILTLRISAHRELIGRTPLLKLTKVTKG